MNWVVLGSVCDVKFFGEIGEKWNETSTVLQVSNVNVDGSCE